MTPELTRREWLQLSGLTALSPLDSNDVSEWLSNSRRGVSDTDWASYHNGTTNTGHNPNTGPGAGAGLTKLHHTHGGYEAPVIVADNTMYAVNRYGELLAVDTDTGTHHWTFKTSDQIVSSPTLRNGTVFIGCTNSTVYAVDATDGSEQWSYTITEGGVSAPTVSNGTVYFGGYDKTLYAVDASDGSEDWQVSTNGAFISGVHRISSAPAVVNGTVFAGNQGGELYALDASDGAQQWKQTPGGTVWAPVLKDGTVYVGTTSGGVFAFDQSDGTQQWLFSTPQRLTAPAVANDTVYVARYEGAHKGDYDVRLYAVDAADGSRQWTYTTGGKLAHAPIVADGRVYLSVDDPPKLLALEASDGSELTDYSSTASNDFDSPGGITAPVVADGDLHVGTANGNLWTVSDSTDPGSGTPPVASFDVSPDAPEIGQTVTLDASASSDSDGSISTYEWDVDGDGTYEQQGETVETTFDSTGDHTVSLRVTDGQGLTASTETTISVGKSAFQQIKDSHLSAAQEVDDSSRTGLSAVDFAETANQEYTTAVEDGDLAEDDAIEALQRLDTGIEITATVIDYVGPDAELADTNQVNLTKKMALPTLRTVFSLVTSMMTAASKVSQEGGSLLQAVVQGAKNKAIEAGNGLAKRILGQAGDIEGTIQVECSQLAEDLLNNFYGVAADVEALINDAADAVAELIAKRLRDRIEQGFSLPVPGLAETPLNASPASLEAGVRFFYELLAAENVVADGLPGSTNTAYAESGNAQDEIKNQAMASVDHIETFQSYANDFSLAGAILDLLNEPNLWNTAQALVSVVLSLIGGVFDALSTGAGLGGLININVSHHLGLYEVTQGDTL